MLQACSPLLVLGGGWGSLGSAEACPVPHWSITRAHAEDANINTFKGILLFVIFSDICLAHLF